jgi:aminoglycoside phosphotransferase (APT) family kinase protein
MRVTSDYLCVRHLFELGLVAPAEVVEGEVVFIPAEGRNRNVEVRRGNVNSCFVKHPRSMAGADLTSREERAYAFLNEHAPDIRSHLPTAFDWGHGGSALVLDLIAEAESLYLLHMGSPSPPPTAIARELGRILAGVHSAPAPRAADAVPRAGPPLVFSLTCVPYDVYCRLSAAEIECVMEIQRAEHLGPLLDNLARDWVPQCFCHGDPRLGNVLVAQPAGEAPRVWLIDWEFAGVGDPASDVGGMMAEYLSIWLSSMPDLPQVGADELVRTAGRPLTDVQPAIKAMWRAYADEAALHDDARPRDLLKSIRFAAAGLVQIALALGQRRPVISGLQLLHLQVAENILVRPFEAAVQLFGFAYEEVVPA